MCFRRNLLPTCAQTLEDGESGNVQENVEVGDDPKLAQETDLHWTAHERATGTMRGASLSNLSLNGPTFAYVERLPFGAVVSASQTSPSAATKRTANERAPRRVPTGTIDSTPTVASTPRAEALRAGRHISHGRTFH